MVAATKVVPFTNGRTPEQWAETIRSKWQDNVSSIFEVALMLETAKEELGVGFGKMVRDELKWSKRTADMLVVIADDNKLTKENHGSLPPSWRTLYELTRLTDEQFDAGIKSGVIHAGMERKDIAQLKPPKLMPLKSKEPEYHGQELIERRAMAARKAIVALLAPMTPEEQSGFLALMRFQLDDLEKRRVA